MKSEYMTGYDDDLRNWMAHPNCYRVSKPLYLATQQPAQSGELVADFFEVVFDGPPSHESGRFVECEDSSGKSFNAGEWIDRGNGLWALRIKK